MTINSQALTWRELVAKLNDLPQEVLDKPVVFHEEITDETYEVSRNGGIMLSTPHYHGVPSYDESVVEYRAFVRKAE